ncbi:hypothetical protein [Oceanihabitans sediminis]|uniref:hypothetical protein n=1 Tax=Oceanihabitans sediminis TaxID=1812012 RepID=UPI00299D4EF2|nr:hypothetical protein [Oceanihabitans sediminis]MDX1774609.1 hypothetical protein [Oceanihabitans sediminis]
MKIRYTIVVLLLAVAFSCKNETKHKNQQISQTNEITVSDSLQLMLNKGKKWRVNPETQGGVEKMQSIITAFKKEPSKNYIALGKKLSRQTSYIIQNCNMVGPSHDQLHVVLVPMLDAIGNLKEAENSAKGAKALLKLEGLIQDYFNHFEL